MTGYVGQSVGGKHGVQFRCGQEFRLVCMNEMHVGQFWMPAVIGAFALPLLVFMGYMLKRLPQPTEEDIALRNERVTLDGNGRKLLFRSYAPILTLLFVGNFMLLVLRDIKEDFLVNILDMSNQSSWLFARWIRLLRWSSSGYLPLSSSSVAIFGL